MFSLHSEALAWLRYSKRLPVVCTEAGQWNADVIGMNAAMCIEVEIKRTMADLRAEFRGKKAKHYVYSNADKFDRTTSAGYIPNYFYFLVDAELEEKAMAFIAEAAPKAGLAVRQFPARHPFAAGKRGIRVLKPPKKLHTRSPSPKFLRAAVMRMASEICTFRLISDKLKKGEESQALIKLMLEGVVGMEGTLDFEDLLPDLERRGAEMAWVVDRKHWKDLGHVDRARWIFAAQELLTLRRGSDRDLPHEEIV